MRAAIIARQFDVQGRLVTVEPYGSGNVNDTYLAIFRTTFSEQRFIVQRIRKAVFPQPEVIMQNMRVLTDHCHAKLETEAEGAVRETVEEAGAHIALEGMFSVLNVVKVGQVHVFYRAALLDTVFDPGPETIEARLFRQQDIPWHDLAFRTVRVTLERYFEDRARGQFGLHCADIG